MHERLNEKVCAIKKDIGIVGFVQFKRVSDRQTDSLTNGETCEDVHKEKKKKG